MVNKKEFDYLGITKFHEKGYKGSIIYIASKEDVLEGVFDDVECRDPFLDKSDDAEHGTSVMDFIRQILPDAKKLATGLNGEVKKGIWYCKDMDELLQFPPDILISSNYSTADSEESHMSKYKELLNKGCFLISGAGNKGSKGVLNMVKNDVFKAVGACRFKGDKLEKTTASSEGIELDFMSLDNLVAAWDGQKKKGTSFAGPVFAGMCGLVQEFFYMNTGSKLTHEKLIEFIKDNCVDLHEEGFDIKTGYGIFILPDPDSIDVTKYADEEFVKAWENILENRNDSEEGGTKEMENTEVRYKYLKDIPEGEFHDVIEFMIENKYINGFNAAEDIEETEVDLSLDMVRMFVINFRAGLYKEIGG